MDRARDRADRGLGLQRRAQRPVGDALGENLQPQVERLVALHDQRLELLGAGHVGPVVVQDPDLGRVVGAQREDAPDHRLQPVRAGAVGRERRVLLLDQARVERADDDLEDLGLRAEVRVEAAREQPAGLGDVTRRRRRVPLVREQALGDDDDLFSPRGGPGRLRTRHGAPIVASPPLRQQASDC